MRCGADFILSICLLFNCKAYLNSVIVWRGSMAARSIVLTGRSQHIALFVAFLLVVCVFLRYKDLLWEALRHRYDKATSLNPRKWVNGVLCSWCHQACAVWYDLVLVLDFEVTNPVMEMKYGAKSCFCTLLPCIHIHSPSWDSMIHSLVSHIIFTSHHREFFDGWRLVDPHYLVLLSINLCARWQERYR